MGSGMAVAGLTGFALTGQAWANWRAGSCCHTGRLVPKAVDHLDERKGHLPDCGSWRIAGHAAMAILVYRELREGWRRAPKVMQSTLHNQKKNQKKITYYVRVNP